MSAFVPQNIDKYQGVVPNRILAAVQKASARTGVDFSFLMAKASTESGFNPSAKAKSSSATGLFQFIDSTWLNMIKQYGDKYGLGKLADQIQIRGGKPCVDDCSVKNEILNLRKNPEISALMAGEFSADNKEFLEKNTKGSVGATELYLAHFMGARNAAKFLNCRDCDGAATAADLFPTAARANKGIFFDKETRQPRTLDNIYALFADKLGLSETAKTTTGENKIAHSITGGNTSPPTTAALPPDAAERPATTPARPSPRTPPVSSAGQVISQVISFENRHDLPSFDDADESDDIIWNDDPRFKNAVPSQKLSPINFMVMMEMQDILSETKSSHSFNS